MDINNREFITGPLFIFLMVSGVFPGQPVLAQQDEELVIEEIITIGSRSQRPPFGGDFHRPDRRVIGGRFQPCAAADRQRR